MFNSDANPPTIIIPLPPHRDRRLGLGHFLLGIPGGSILKMLAGTAPSWASKTTVAYVNHKCVDMGDEKLATHAKACKLFLDDWEGINVITLGGSGDSAAEAASYEKAMRDDSNIPTDPETGLPVFDMMLVGVGDDGHVGSLVSGEIDAALQFHPTLFTPNPTPPPPTPFLSPRKYPDRDEVLVSGGDQWVLPVDMKTPGSITLSLVRTRRNLRRPRPAISTRYLPPITQHPTSNTQPVMAGAKEVVIAACGVSDKYPQGKVRSSSTLLAPLNPPKYLTPHPPSIIPRPFRAPAWSVRSRGSRRLLASLRRAFVAR